MISFDSKLRIHSFGRAVNENELPDCFTNPFDYVAHPLCNEAFSFVKDYALSKPEWSNEISEGKMFGVLVVRYKSELGFIAAFSGTLADSSNYEYFAPPVFDFLAKDSYFRREEAKIVSVNREIDAFMHDDEIQRSICEIDEQCQCLLSEVKAVELNNKEAKKLRDQRRLMGLSGDENEHLIAESQFQKANLRRLKQRTNSMVAELQRKKDELLQPVNHLRKRRKEMSNELQDWLFRNFSFLNAKGEERSLYEIFINDSKGIPPSGSGECCAPRLLQWAYACDMHPICMAEYWLGASPKNEIRREGHSYPACKNKCQPILGFMLQGLDVDKGTMSRNAEGRLPILYCDEYIIAIDKPSGMLSVPGKDGTISAQELLSSQISEESLVAVHRLDMSTSGILLFARSRMSLSAFQSMFAKHEMRKVYVALLDGKVECVKGVISLPIASDFNHRPCQMVDYVNGKEAVTEYEVISFENSKTRIHFYPHTGRTHQLRVHSAHCDGLNVPIVGDMLYGKPAERLCLHAERLEFIHPFTKNEIVIVCPSTF